jgi:TRAP-type C4-dicarboxylate transport system substrate-binding protein
MLVQTTLLMLATAITLCVSERAKAQTRWKLPSAYPADNFHSKNLAVFAKDVAASTGGKLEITIASRGRSVHGP